MFFTQTIISTHRHPAYPVSALVLHPTVGEIPALPVVTNYETEDGERVFLPRFTGESWEEA